MIEIDKLILISQLIEFYVRTKKKKKNNKKNPRLEPVSKALLWPSVVARFHTETIGLK